ncbi:hypothetical protein QJQ45_000587 [Haematococcus lacustris]|nr:hypothetical protein QJQ45_000587 [Haematococcus lacustris]
MLKHMQEWHAANNTVLSCSQFVKAELRLPGVTVPCQLNVMPSLLPDFDVLLGNDWLNEHEAVMSYQDKTLSLACDKSEPVVLPCPSAGVSQSGQSAVSNPASFLVNALRAKPPLASAKVAARWLRKGGTGVLALITVDNSSTPDPAPAEPDLPPGVSQALNALLDEYADVFAPITSLPPERPVGHAIPLVPDARPSVVPQYRMSQEEHAELKKQVQDLLAKGMIEPSSSPFAAPILFVKKKSGELRMCLDYRQLNKITIRDQYPLPRIDDLFDKLSGCTVFSSLDLQAGYNQIRITPEDVPKTAFRTPDGHYQFKVLSFGLCNAPATFQRVMNDAFAPVLNQCALVYLDDILVMSKSVDEHLKHLRKVFDLLRLNKLFAKQSKCEFMRTTLKFLGHVIFAGAIAVDPEKIKSISSWPVPQSLQQLQSFLGAANFVRKFVHNFSVLAAPLTDLCGKAGDSFLWHNWPADELKAFASLKAAVAQVPMLRLPDHTQPFQVYCDASLQGVGAVLMQDGYPLAYLSKKLSSAERNYTTGEQELLALITACKEWRCYLEGVPFTLFTDHKPLTALPTQKVLSRRQARWMEFLSRFTFDLQYLPGDANPADPLSRIPAGPQDCAMVCVVTTRRQAKQSLERGEVRVAQALPQVPPVGTPSNAPTAVDALAPRPTVSDNPVAAHHSRLPELEAPSAADTSVHYPAAPAHPLELADHLVHGYRLDPAFTAEADLSGMYMDDHGLWRRTGKGTVMVPNDPELREYILHEMHDAAYAGHVGITKTLERLSRVFYWDTMRADVRHYVTTCDACQRDKSSTLKPGGLLNPLSIPDYRWESVSMDLITKLPSASHGFDAICVFVDRLSKMVHFVPCKESMNAKGFARLFVDNVFKLHGLPKDMVSDRGPHFHNTFWHHVQKLLGMRGSLSSSYHPQSDGQTERYNRVLEEMLRHYISPTQADWPDYLSLAEFAVNNSWQESIKSTPFLVNTGQSPITPMLHSLPDKGRCPEGLSYATWWQEAVAKAKLCMQAAQQRQAAYANQDRRDVHYKVGQMVLLSTKNMRLKPGKARKLLPRFVGPFKVLGLVGQVAVNLQLPASMSRLHPVFHVSLIKPYTGTDVGFMPPPVEWLDEEPVYYVERLLDHRHVHAGKAKEYLVQWEGYDADHNTWEPRSNLVGCDKILAEYNAAHNLNKPEQEELKRQIQDYLAKGMIEPSSSPYVAPILFVQKKSGELRMCIDYRQLNKLTLRDQYPLPRIDDLFDRLSGCSVFSSLDLQAGYHQIRITLEDVPKTAFRTPEGHFQFKVLSFGLANAPATFQRVMNDAFAPVLGKCALVYLDDILVMSKSLPEHLQHLRLVFNLLRKNKLYAKMSKCEFMQLTLRFLGHVISAGAISVDPDKVRAIVDWPVPYSLTQMQSFLGAANFVRKFVHNFSAISAPLTDLCGKLSATFPWHSCPDHERHALYELKAAVANVPMLRLPDHTQPFQVYCDASLQGVGAVLMQGGYPLAYLSKKLSSAEVNYTTGEQEMLALVTACKEWRCYLEGVPFTLFTDHKPLISLPTQKNLSRRQARWMELLSRFDFKLEYIPGPVNPADPLSRLITGHQEGATVCAMLTRRQAKLSCGGEGASGARALEANAPAAVTAKSSLTPEITENTADTSHNRDLVPLVTCTSDTSVHYPAAPAHPLGLSDQLIQGYRLDPAFNAEADLSSMYQDTHGLWRLTGKDKVVVPNDSELRNHILHEMHDAVYSGHVGISKTLERVSRVFWWNTMRADVRYYVSTCDACQRDKASSLKPGGLLNPLSIPDYRWESVSMDFITKLPAGSHGYDAICVFVDRLSKMVHFVPCREDLKARRFAQLFIDHVYKLHGMPAELISDRGSLFTSVFWREVMRRCGSKPALSSSYHPQSDGQTERYNRVLEEMLRHYISPTQSDWPDYLALAEFAVNNSWQESIQSTPFLVNTGQSPVTVGLRDLPYGGRCPSAHAFTRWWQDAVANARKCMAAAQSRQAAYANKARRDVEYKVGQKVLLSTKHLKLQPGKARKLIPRYVGPFEILLLVGAVAVKLDLPASMSRLHPVFHVSLIKPYTGTDVGFMPPPVTWMDETPVYYVERLLDHKGVKDNKASYYLVQWEGYDSTHNTWEPRSNLTDCDKVLAEYNAIHHLNTRTSVPSRPAQCYTWFKRSSASVTVAEKLANGTCLVSSSGRPPGPRGPPGRYSRRSLPLLKPLLLGRLVPSLQVGLQEAGPQPAGGSAGPHAYAAALEDRRRLGSPHSHSGLVTPAAPVALVPPPLPVPTLQLPRLRRLLPRLPRYDVFLGDDWLFANKAILSYEGKTLSLSAAGKTAVTLPCPAVAAPKYVGQCSAVRPTPAFLINALKAKPELISASQASRWLLKGGRAVVALVMAEGSASATPGTPSDQDNQHIPAAIKAELQTLLDEYNDVFKPLTDTPPERPVGHTIPLVPDARSPVTPIYRLSKPEQEELKRQIQDYLAKGMIEPSSSPYVAPILFVQKKSGELRMCIDYRQLNKLTLRDQYPLPRIDDLFDRLSGCSVFSSLDLQAGYHQIRITLEDVPKTAFRTPEGHFRFKVLSFGLTNAPATFQRVMNDAFAPVLGKCALVYLDDILVMSKSLPEHLQHLRLVFNLLRKNKLYAKMSKCEFMQLTLRFLGHVISAGAISVDPDKVRAIVDWPVPYSLTQMQSFLGAANFVRKFVHNFSAISAPLTDLCGKLSATFPWHSCPDHERHALYELKAAVANVPMLRLPDHTQPFQVYCDASLQGVGAVLMQGGYPLAYLSKKLSSAEVNYTTGEQEMLALVTACKEWRCYLEGVPFTLFTDHKPLISLPTQKNLSRRQARWMELLSRFDFKLEYIPGPVNPADPLSRLITGHQEGATVCAMLTRRQAKLSCGGEGASGARALEANAPAAVTAKSSLTPEITENTADTSHNRDLVPLVTCTSDTSVHYPAAPAHPLGLSDQLIQGYRLDPAFNAEADLSSMYQDTHGLWRLTGKDKVVVPNDSELRNHILHEMHDAVYSGHVGISKTLERVSRVFWWNTMRADVRLSKMVHFVPCREDLKARRFAQLFIDHVYKLHGMPAELISDRGSLFTSVFWREVMRRCGSKPALSSSYHPQSDGQTERYNRVLEEMLRHYISPTQSDWPDYLALAEFAVNNSWQESIQSTPFLVNTGQSPVTVGLRDRPYGGRCPSAHAFTRWWQDAVANARKCMAAAQSRQAAYANKARRDVEYKVGQKVLLSTKHLKLQPGKARKLIPRYVGPFEILLLVGAVAVKLDLPASMSRLHPVFHVSLIKPYTGTDVGFMPPPVTWMDETPVYYVERLLDHKGVKDNKASYYLVQWEGYDSTHNTWEPRSNLTDCDKVLAEYNAIHHLNTRTSVPSRPAQCYTWFKRSSVAFIRLHVTTSSAVAMGDRRNSVCICRR